MYKILPLWIWYLCIPFLVPHFEMMHSNYEKERKKSSWLLIKVWNPIAIALPLIWYGVEFFWWISLRLDQLHSVWKSLKMLKKASFGFFFFQSKTNFAHQKMLIVQFWPTFKIQIEYLCQLQIQLRPFSEIVNHLHHYRPHGYFNGLFMPQHLQPASTQPLMVQRTVVLWLWRTNAKMKIAAICSPT